MNLPGSVFCHFKNNFPDFFTDTGLQSPRNMQQKIMTMVISNEDNNHNRERKYSGSFAAFRFLSIEFDRKYYYFQPIPEKQQQDEESFA